MDNCTCPIRPDMTYRDLMEEIVLPQKYCTSLKSNRNKGWMCPTLDKALRTARIDKRYQDTKQKKLEQKGFSSEESAKIVSSSKKKRSKDKKVYKKRSLSELE